MIILIQPVKIFSQNEGMVEATQVDVNVVQYQLGQRCTFSYTVQRVDTTTPGAPRTISLASGQNTLTDAQFAEWGADDRQPALAVVRNVGLTPA
jgi:hypothetical protein